MNSEVSPQAIVTISKEQLSALPAAQFSGDIRLIEDEKGITEAIETLRNSDIIGFDTETRPSFRKGQTNTVSLIQLSTRNTCFLFRINHLGLAQPIVDLLEDADVLKIGLSIHDDFHNLNRITIIRPQGFIELQNYVKEYRIADNSLTKIYAVIFGKRISKGQRLTNWEAEQLTNSQMTYAALDAMACVEIYDHIASGKFKPEESQYLTIPASESDSVSKETDTHTQTPE
ncbi:MAG: 3'-5' exonuclease domain-containing protein 2 [Muribaculaceae bacterium]|nr:3'-5' exonuclease domain-containing protein 2 [Muribaculaceae bacterium]MDE6772596.1 3'-5' exonuclease domain-containing protein 2 [Muribaculaceae bacterium]